MRGATLERVLGYILKSAFTVKGSAMEVEKYVTMSHPRDFQKEQMGFDVGLFLKDPQLLHLE